MVASSKKLGRLGRAILEDFVEGKLDGKFVAAPTAPTDEQIAIEAAMQATADRLWKKWPEKTLWKAIFNPLPKKKKLLIDLKQAVKVFYVNPADKGFAGVLTEILQERLELPPKAIKKAVREYVTILTDELILVDKDFCENVRGLTDLRSVKIIKRMEPLPASQQQPISPKTDDFVTPLQAEEADSQAALAKLKKLPLKKIPKAAFLPKSSRFPDIRPKPVFVGREEELKQLAAWLKKGESPVVIGQAAIGMEGVGKTQLASEFANRYGQYFSGGVFWLNFAEPQLIPFEVAACGGPTEDTLLDARVKQVLTDWQSEMPRLLIFDNCEDPGLLVKWRPSKGGSRVLVTSRQNGWKAALGVKKLTLGPLERLESLALLQGFLQNPEEIDPDLDAIANELEDMPLALHMTGSFLRTYRQEMNAGIYLNSLHKPMRLNHRWLKSGEFPYSKDNPGAARTLVICLNRVVQDGEIDPPPMDLLKRIACLAPGESIPRELLRMITGDENIDAKVFEDGLNRLLGMGLVDENEAGQIRMHALVAGFVREILPDKGGLVQVEQAVISAAADANQSGHPGRMQPLLPHLKHLTDLALKRGDAQAARLANELGYHLAAIGEYEGARSHYEQALSVNRKLMGEEHPYTARSLNNLGYLLDTIGDYPDARPYYEKALAIRRKVLGEEHPETARSFSNLGYLLQVMDNHPAARSYLEQALAIRRKVLGAEHPDTARSLNNLGELLQAVGDYPAARSHYEQALAIRRKVLGEEHADTAASINDMGSLLQALGDFQGARLYYGRALAIRRKVLGGEHPAAAASLNNLGRLSQAMGDYKGALSYYEQALAIRRKVLGEEHPATAASLSNLGGLLQAMGDNAGAKSYYEQALAIRRKVLGNEHPDTVLSLNNLGGLMQAMGDNVGARSYHKQALSISNKVPGEVHSSKARNLSFRTKIVVAILFVFSFAVIVFQIFGPGPIPNALLWSFANFGQIGARQLPPIFQAHTSTPSETATFLRTATPTRTASFTATRYTPNLINKPTTTRSPVSLNSTNTPLPTRTHAPPTRTSVPSTNVPTPRIPPTPTDVPLPSNTPVPTVNHPTPHQPTDTPAPPTDIPPTAVPPTAVPPTDVPPTAVPPTP